MSSGRLSHAGLLPGGALGQLGPQTNTPAGGATTDGSNLLHFDSIGTRSLQSQQTGNDRYVVLVVNSLPSF